MRIETYWEKVLDEILMGDFQKVDHGNYELHRSVTFVGGWNSDLEYWEQRARDNDTFVGEISEGCFKYDLGRAYGIHSYQLVYPMLKE